MNLFKRKEWTYAYQFYIVGFLAFISLITIVPIRSWMPNSIYSVCYLFFLGLGCILMVQDLFTRRCMLQTSLWWTVVACSGIMAFNTFFHRVGGSLADDVKTTIWAIELVTVCYSARIQLKDDRFSKTMSLALNLVLFIHSIAALVSVIQAQLNVTETIIARGASFAQGFWSGRLWGVYMSPGYPASVVCMVLAVFFMSRYKKWCQRIVYLFCIVVNYYSFLLENSRACEVEWLMAVACMAWALGRKVLYRTKGKRIVKEGIALLLSVTCVISVYFIDYGCRTLAYYSVGSFAEKGEVGNKDYAAIRRNMYALAYYSPGGTMSNNKMMGNAYAVIRRNIFDEDIRIDIWKEYISAYSREMSPLGYNKSGYQQYLIERYPKELEVVAGHNLGPHNGYIDTLYRTGWIGAILFGIWIVYHLWYGLQYIIKKITLSPEEMGCFAVIVILMVDGVFSATMFWDFTFLEVMIFWLLAGDLTFMLQEGKQGGR